jgi:hypothetical protein
MLRNKRESYWKESGERKLSDYSIDSFAVTFIYFISFSV